MPTLRLTVQTMTPLLMFGAENDNRTGQPELRGASVRGLLRYWLRAVLGVQHEDSNKLYEAESKILGSTDQGSKVNIRVQASRSMRVEDRLRVMPERISGVGYEPEGEFRITLSTHPLDESDVLEGDLLKAVYLLMHFGGMGKRSRRGSGNLRVIEAKNANEQGKPSLVVLPSDGDNLMQYLTDVSEYVGTTPASRRPNHPVFAPDTAVVLVDPEPYYDYQEAFKHLWEVSGPYHHAGGVFGDVRPRRASAIHMRVGLSDAGYHPQMTIFYSGSGDWHSMQNFIERARNNGFQRIYGNEENWQ